MQDNKKVIGIIFILFIIILCIIFGILLTKNNSERSVAIQISEKDYKYFILKSDNKMGIINVNGEIVIEPKFDSIIIPNPTKDVFICKNANEDNTVILNKESKVILDKYENVEYIYTEGTVSSIPYEKKLLKYKKDGKYGLINYEGKKITNAIYDELKSVKYKEGEILAKKDGKYGVINGKGKVIIKFEYDQIEGDKFSQEKFNYKSSGYIAYKKLEQGYRYAYINYKGKTILKPEYNSIERITAIENENEQWLIVSKNGQYGVVKNGKIIIDFLYQKIEFNSDNDVFLVNRNNRYGVFNKKGEQILEVKYKEIEFNGIYIYTKSGTEEKYYYADGTEADNNYKSMSKVSNNNYYIAVNNENLYGILDKNKKILISNKYAYIEFLFENYFLAFDKQNGITIVDENDNRKLDEKYNSISKIGDLKLIKCEKKTKWKNNY